MEADRTWYGYVAKNGDVVVAKTTQTSEEEARRLLEKHGTVECVTGPMSWSEAKTWAMGRL